MFSVTRQLRLKSLSYMGKRWRHKKKWAATRAEKSASEHALTYFDNFYPPVYGRQWPSFRLALLSRQKYGALLNNFANSQENMVQLVTEGADDILQLANETPLRSDFETTQGKKMDAMREPDKNAVKIPGYLYNSEDKERDIVSGDSNRFVGGTSLQDFMPVKRVISENEELSRMEVEQGFYDPHELEVKVVPGDELYFPAHLKVLVKERGNIDLFPSPKKDSSGKLNYYPFDAASVLPVLTLGVQPGDSVLDLCAAPGGKTLALLQTMLPDTLVCVDDSYSRLGRLRDIIRSYLPHSYLDDKRVETIHGNGIQFCHAIKHDTKFDRILVDVPCYTDRHAVLEDDNSIFRPSRQRERLAIQNTQKELLSAALSCVKLGGSVVYSTCTLSPPQNDGIIQAALEHIWENTDMDVVVKDTSIFAEKFRDTFNFYDKCRFGQLVLPNLAANFGPMYFCKLQRLR